VFRCAGCTSRVPTFQHGSSAQGNRNHFALTFHFPPAQQVEIPSCVDSLTGVATPFVVSGRTLNVQDSTFQVTPVTFIGAEAPATLFNASYPPASFSYASVAVPAQLAAMTDGSDPFALIRMGGPQQAAGLGIAATDLGVIAFLSLVSSAAELAIPATAECAAKTTVRSLVVRVTGQLIGQANVKTDLTSKLTLTAGIQGIANALAMVCFGSMSTPAAVSLMSTMSNPKLVDTVQAAVSAIQLIPSEPYGPVFEVGVLS
jgi:hypothetical protein